MTKAFEFELVVYVKTRTREHMEDFLKEYWVDQKIFLKEYSTTNLLFTELIKRVKLDSEQEYPSTLSCFYDIFSPKNMKRCKSGNLSKCSYFEFIKRQKDDNQIEEEENAFLTKKSKNIELSKRKFKIIDYGNCYDYSDERYGLINTRQYRAPEVILSKRDLDYKEWCEKTDIWSLGCLLFELYKGGLCFPTHESYHHLALIEKR